MSNSLRTSRTAAQSPWPPTRCFWTQTGSMRSTVEQPGGYLPAPIKGYVSTGRTARATCPRHGAPRRTRPYVCSISAKLHDLISPQGSMRQAQIKARPEKNKKATCVLQKWRRPETPREAELCSRWKETGERITECPHGLGLSLAVKGATGTRGETWTGSAAETPALYPWSILMVQFRQAQNC